MAPGRPRGILAGAIATLAIAALAVPVILLGFDGFFLRFHEVFFSGSSWRFSDTDTLLRIYPEVFWQDTAKLAAGIVVVQAVVVGLAAWWCGAPGRRGSPERLVIDLHRPAGGVLRIGHRGAATLAPENTLRSFRAAVDGRGRPDRVRRARSARAARSCSLTRIISTR